MKTLKELKEEGVKVVVLDGFKESLDYCIGLIGVKYVGCTKSEDGYGLYHCFESI